MTKRMMPEPSEKDRAVAMAWAKKVDCDVVPTYLIASMRINKEEAVKKAEKQKAQDVYAECLIIISGIWSEHKSISGPKLPVEEHKYDLIKIVRERIQKAADKAGKG